MGVELGQVDHREFELSKKEHQEINISAGSIIRIPIDKPPIEKIVVPTKEQQVIKKEAGYEITKVTVEPIPDEYTFVSGTLEITENGNHNVKSYEEVNVNVPVPDLSATTATADDVFTGKKFYNAQGEFVDGTYKDIMQRYIDFKKNCDSLFYNFTDTDMNWANKLDTSQIKTMYRTFGWCRNISTLNLNNYRTPNVTSVDSLFYYCDLLETLDISNFDTSNCLNFNMMFSNDSKLKTVYGTLNLINATKISNMLRSVQSLENITLKNIKLSLEMGTSSIFGTKLSNETLINTFKELWDLTGATSQTLTLSTTSKNNIANIYVKLIEATDEMRAEDPYIDNKKPCVVCESTDEGAMTLTEYAILKNWAIG